ncbi:MAG: amino acid ABC transporter permease [Eubacterium sp.]|nr:amino acid ABC transporter permease [Eubacterium sp.]
MKIDWGFVREAFPEVIKYIPVTLQLTLITFLISFPLGVILALINHHNVKGLAKIVRVYISLIRGTPVLLQIYVVYNILPMILTDFLKSIGSDFKVYSLSAKIFAYLALSISTTVTISEAVRSGLVTVNKGQREAAKAVGLNNIETFFHVVFPQAFAAAFPVIVNGFVDLIKVTSLAFLMTVVEITGKAQLLGGMELRYLEAYVTVAFVYIILIVAVELIAKPVEKRLNVYRGGKVRNAAG